MNAWVCVRLANGRVVELFPGSIIGRSVGSDLAFADPWVSEAHAIVSLRDGVLKLLALRGRFELAGISLTELVLRPGITVRFSATSAIDVVEVMLPDRVLWLSHPDFGRVLLTRTSSVFVSARRVAPGADAHADAVLYSDGAAWYARHAGVVTQLVAGQRIEIAHEAFLVQEIDTADAGIQTAGAHVAEAAPMVIAVLRDVVQVRRDARVLAAFDGKIGIILEALALERDGHDWRNLSRSVWPEVSEPTVMRRNWDAAMARLRKKLRAAGVRVDLVRSDYGGRFQLKLYRGDTISDER
jgi:hypothetical protein